MTIRILRSMTVCLLVSAFLFGIGDPLLRGIGPAIGPAIGYGQDDPAPAPAAKKKVADDVPAIPEEKSMLVWAVEASGVFGFLILLASFVMVALIMTIALQLRRQNYLPADFIDAFEQQLNAKNYQGAYELAKGDNSFIARIMTAGMGRLSRGYEASVQGMEEVGEDETMAMDQKIGYLSLIGTIAPMLGLLGTVQGMVLSFSVIARSPTTPKPSELADGIATALFTTLEGLVVAIPAMIFFSIFKNRLQRYVLESGFITENLMGRFQTMNKPGAKPATPA